MRKESSNQFTEGLVCDLNPINTPNTVLTDNINGTIITYDGNEFSLQNDLGNYELKNCRLKPNYIPVGVKEYGDILYIVSYNPLDNHVEVGSYPSPLNVGSKEPLPSNVEFKSILEPIVENNESPSNYSDLVKQEKQIIFSGDDYKLYPGDEYQLDVEGLQTYLFENVEYFILDDSSILHDITSEIKINSDFKHVSWLIPGWLVAKIRLAKLSGSELNIKTFYAPLIDGKRKVSYDFNFKINIEDPIINKLLNENPDHIKDLNFDVKIKNNNGDPGTKELNKSVTKWYLDNNIVWVNCVGELDCEEKDTIMIQTTPTLTEYDYLDDGAPDRYTIVYDNLTQTQEFDLDKIDDIPFAVDDDYYKFYQRDSNEQTIEVKITGPSITSSKVNLNYQICDIDDDNNVIKEGSFIDYTGIGNNVLTISFDDNFINENVYILKFIFDSEEESLKSESKKLLICTKLLNGTEEFDNYQVKAMNHIADKYLNDLKIINNGLQYTFDKPQLSGNTNAIVKKFLSDDKYNCFIPVDEDLGNSVDVDIPYSISFDEDDFELENNDCLLSQYLNITRTYSIDDDMSDLSLPINHTANLNLQLTTNQHDSSIRFTNAELKTLDKYGLIDQGGIPEYTLTIYSNRSYEFNGGRELGIYAYGQLSSDSDLLNIPFTQAGYSASLNSFPYYKLKLTVPNTMEVNAFEDGLKPDGQIRSIDLIVFQKKTAYYYEDGAEELLNGFDVIYNKDAKIINVNITSGELENKGMNIEGALTTRFEINGWNDRWKNNEFENNLVIADSKVKDVKKQLPKTHDLSEWVEEQNRYIAAEKVNDTFIKYTGSLLCKQLNEIRDDAKNISGVYYNNESTKNLTIDGHLDIAIWNDIRGAAFEISGEPLIIDNITIGNYVSEG